MKNQRNVQLFSSLIKKSTHSCVFSQRHRFASATTLRTFHQNRCMTHQKDGSCCDQHRHQHHETNKESSSAVNPGRTDETYQKLFEGNREFVKRKLALDENYFSDMANKSQTPNYMLIGCSDSRVPPDQLTMTQPGDIFIHRNVANLVVNTDLNVMSVLQYAVEVLKVKHVIVMGHYKCGGVLASMEHTAHGLIDKWLRNIKDVQRLHKDKLDATETFEERFNLLVELNVVEQALNLCKTSIVQRAWKTGQELHVHGWVYDLGTGIIKDLEIEEKVWRDIAPIYKIRFPDLPYKSKPKNPQDYKAAQEKDNNEEEDVGVPQQRK